MTETSKQILSALLVFGAQSPSRAVGISELALRFGMEAGAVKAELRVLAKAGYVGLIPEEDTDLVYLTGTGIITASSTYS